jgi:hypothetical protein
MVATTTTDVSSNQTLPTERNVRWIMVRSCLRKIQRQGNALDPDGREDDVIFPKV